MRKVLMRKVLISAPYMLRATERPKVAALLKPYGLDVTWAQVHERLEEADLLDQISSYEGIICGDDRITAKVLDEAKNLKVIVKWGTGIDSIDSAGAQKRGIAVHRTPNAFTEPVADTTLGLILSFCRGIATNDRILKQGGWDKPQGFTLSERTVGLIGFGDIGQAVAKRLQAFGATTLVNDIAKKDQAAASRLGAKLASKEEIFETADFISLHCDLNPTSHQVLNRTVFSKLKKCPYIINTARGPLIEEEALVQALLDGRIAGAGLDVFEYEPLPLDSPLRKMENVLLASHNSNSSPQCWEKVHRNSIGMLIKGLGLE